MDFGKEIKTALAARLGQERFELWFSDVALTRQEDKVTVATRTAFSLERLKKDFHNHLKSVAQELGLHDLTIQYEINPSLVEQQKTSSQPTGRFHNEGEQISCDEERQTGQTLTASEPQTSHRTDTPTLAIRARTAPAPSAKPESNRRHRLLAASRPARGRKFQTLDGFVEGSCNQLARTSIDMVLKQPGEINPLLIHGPTGVGKTHLMEGIWSRTRKQRRARIVYLSAEQFTTYFLEALRGDGLPNFRRKYRQADVLIIDDIQFFQGKQATLVELAYTIDELSREHRQLVLTADRPPAQLASCLGRDIANRLSGGLVCVMKPIDHDTMENISIRWANERQLDIAPEIHKTIAARAGGDARQLAGVLNRLRAATFALNEPITMRMANEVMYELLPTQSRVIRLKDVQKAVCEMFGLESDSLHQKSRSKAITQPRMLAMFLSKKHTAAGLHEISSFYGRRSHSSAVTANNSVLGWLDAAKSIQINGQLCDVRDVVSQLEQKLRVG